MFKFISIKRYYNLRQQAVCTIASFYYHYIKNVQKFSEAFKFLSSKANKLNKCQGVVMLLCKWPTTTKNTLHLELPGSQKHEKC